MEKGFLRWIAGGMVLLLLAVMVPSPLAATTTMTEFAIPTLQSGPAQVASGPDGALWFTESAGNRIGRITPDGAMTEYAVPTAMSKPDGITTGPDGNLWFTELAGNKIGRITPDGVMTEFSIPTPDSKPLRITVGADGNLWFTESAGNKIGRISPAGGITEYPLPSSNAHPFGITLGPDRMIWFTENTGHKIGRITPAGTMTEFDLIRNANIEPRDITTGPDGNLWFTVAWAGLGFVTTGGQGAAGIRAVPSANANPIGITTGPDHALWFTEFTANKIGRYQPDLPSKWEPRISIVWPHNSQGQQTGVLQATAVNAGVWPANSVQCTEPVTMTLLATKDTEPAETVGNGEAMTHTIGGITFRSQDYNDIPVDLQANPGTNYHFFTKWWGTQWYRYAGSNPTPYIPPEIAGSVAPSNVWVHAADPRTILPQPVRPDGITQHKPQHVDTRIQIVWPHDNQGAYAPVETATAINLAVDIFEHGSHTSVPADFISISPQTGTVEGPVLYIAEGNTPLHAATAYDPNMGGNVFIKPVLTSYTLNGITYPRWVFNDIPVQPGGMYHFLVLVYGVENSPSVWTHAKDARTNLPAPVVPPACR